MRSRLTTFSICENTHKSEGYKFKHQSSVFNLETLSPGFSMNLEVSEEVGDYIEKFELTILMKMKRLFQLIMVFVAISIVSTVELKAQESLDNTVETNNWGGKQKESPFGLGLDVQTKYMWRGMEMMTQKSSPVLFPSVNYTCGGLYICYGRLCS